VLSKGIVVLGILLVLSISLTPAFALTELERVTISDPRLENDFGSHVGNNLNVDQHIQISVDITNNQEQSQQIVYLVQIKDKTGFVISLNFIKGVELNPHQKFSLSLPWTPDNPGEFTAEIFVWGGVVNHSALAEYTTLQINVS